MKTAKTPRKPVIVTKAFTLRPIRNSDAADIVKLINDKGIARNLLSVPHPYGMKDAREWLRRVSSSRRKKIKTWISFAIDIDGRLVGDISIFKIKGHKAEIGYWLGRPYWGKGIMTRAVKEIVKFAFNDLGLTRISAYTFIFNKGSQRVLEKAGFKREGILRKNVAKGDKLLDEYLFAKIKTK